MTRALLARAAVLLARVEDVHVWSHAAATGQGTVQSNADLGRTIERAHVLAQEIRCELDRTAHEVAQPVAQPVKNKPRRKAA